MGPELYVRTGVVGWEGDGSEKLIPDFPSSGVVSEFGMSYRPLSLSWGSVREEEDGDRLRDKESCYLPCVL